MPRPFSEADLEEMKKDPEWRQRPCLRCRKQVWLEKPRFLCDKCNKIIS